MKRFLAAFGKTGGAARFCAAAAFGLCFALAWRCGQGRRIVWLAGGTGGGAARRLDNGRRGACELPAVLGGGPDGAVEISRVLTEDAAGNPFCCAPASRRCRCF